MSKSLPKEVAVLGDPHLGRKFKTGVPLHRVGEREAWVWQEFERQLHEHNGSLHINMGDLFDKYIVAPETVIRAAEIYLAAAKRLSSCTFVILEGNHDVSKDSTKSSSFDLFALLVADHDRIIVVRNVPVVINGFGFVPYHPFQPTAELVAMLPDDLEAVFGHWDIQDWGGDNVIPTELLADKGITLAVSGHDHLARQEKRHGVDIIVTGSMQPFTHAEDATGEFYRTVTLEQLTEIEDPRMLNLRVLLKEGESLPDDLDCLSLTAKRITDEDDKLEVDTSEFESLDLRVMLAGVLDQFQCKDVLLTKFEETSE